MKGGASYRVRFRVKIGHRVWLGGSCHTCGHVGDRGEWREWGQVVGEIEHILHDAGQHSGVRIRIEVQRRKVKDA